MDLTTLGIKVTTDGIDQASQKLDKLAGSGDKVAASTEKIAPAVKKAGNALKEYPASQYQRDLEKTISAYSKTEDKLRELATQQKKWNELHKSGSINTREYDAYATSLEKVANRMGLQSAATQKAALSAKQLAQANRQLPMQFTDIAVSIQAGQNPMTVFLQQGGQLKDMYGGVGPALKAMASYILGMVNPLTLAAAASAALFVAWRQGVNEQYEFNKALILTGDRAGLAGRSLRDMVSALDSIDGVSRGTAINALTAVAASGKFTAEQFDLVTAAAAKMSASAGVEIDETVKKFERLRKDPYDALLALTEAENFLTNEQLDRIKVLKDEGREQEAVAEAIRIYADHLDDVSRKSREAMPALESAWRDIKGVITETWGEAVKFLDVLSQIGSAAKNSRVGDVIRGAYNVAIPAHMRPDALQRLLRQANQIAERYAPRETSQTPVVMAGIYGTVDPDEQRKRDREEQERNRERERFFAAETRYLDDKAKKTADIAAVEKLVTDGVISREEATNRIGLIEDEYSRRASRASRTRRQQKSDEQKAIEALERAYASMNGQLERQIALFGDSSNAARVAYEIQSGGLKGLSDQQRSVITEQAEWLDWLEEMADIEKVWADAASDAAEAAAEWQKNIDGVLADLEFEAELIGMSNKQREMEIMLRRLNIDATNEENAALVEQLELRMEEIRTRSQVAEGMDAVRQGAKDFIVDFASGAKSFKDSMMDALNSIHQRMLQIASERIIERMLGSFGSSEGGQAGGLLSKIFSAMSGGYSEGGYTGYGGVYEPAGVVHKGEVVWSQRDVARAGGPAVVEAMRLGVKGYASGGVVGGDSVSLRSLLRDMSGRRGGGNVIQNMTFETKDRTTQEQAARRVGRETQRAMSRTG